MQILDESIKYERKKECSKERKKCEWTKGEYDVLFPLDQVQYLLEAKGLESEIPWSVLVPA